MNPSESWTRSIGPNGDEIISVVGRTKISMLKKLNPIWWLGNDNEPTPPASYMPGSSRPVRLLFWYLRNPLMNFQDYVIGVADRNYSVTGDSPLNVIDLIDIGETGWKRTDVHLKYLLLPFVSYTGTKVLWHIGWYYNGRFQIKFNVLGMGNSPI